MTLFVKKVDGSEVRVDMHIDMTVDELYQEIGIDDSCSLLCGDMDLRDKMGETLADIGVCPESTLTVEIDYYFMASYDAGDGQINNVAIVDPVLEKTIGIMRNCDGEMFIKYLPYDHFKSEYMLEDECGRLCSRHRYDGCYDDYHMIKEANESLGEYLFKSPFTYRDVPYDRMIQDLLYIYPRLRTITPTVEVRNFCISCAQIPVDTYLHMLDVGYRTHVSFVDDPSNTCVSYRSKETGEVLFEMIDELCCMD